MLHMKAEFRADFFPMKIFPKPNRNSNSVKNSESDDIFFCLIRWECDFINFDKNLKLRR